MQAGNKQAAVALFSGITNGQTTETLTAALKYGAASVTMTPDSTDIENWIYQSIVGMIIPNAWSINSGTAGGNYPVIMYVTSSISSRI